MPLMEVFTTDGKFVVSLESHGELNVRTPDQEYIISGKITTAVILSLAHEVTNLRRKIKSVRDNVNAIID